MKIGKIYTFYVINDKNIMISKQLILGKISNVLVTTILVYGLRHTMHHVWCYFQTPSWLAEMIEYPTWRELFYKLAEEYPDCLMLNFTVKVLYPNCLMLNFTVKVLYVSLYSR